MQFQRLLEQVGKPSLLDFWKLETLVGSWRIYFPFRSGFLCSLFFHSGGKTTYYWQWAMVLGQLWTLFETFDPFLWSNNDFNYLIHCMGETPKLTASYVGFILTHSNWKFTQKIIPCFPWHLKCTQDNLCKNLCVDGSKQGSLSRNCFHPSRL